MIRYAHVLNIPYSHPFDQPATRWTTFLGKVVKPICHDQGFLYSFSYYEDHAKLRVHTDNTKVLDDINTHIKNYGLSYRLDDKRNEVDATQTLANDLGTERFLATEKVSGLPEKCKNEKSLDRALRVLKLQHAGCELFLDCLVMDGEYFREEICKHPDNTFDSSSRSYLHLLHNLTQSSVGVVLYQDANGDTRIVSEIDFSYLVPMPRDAKGFEVAL